MSFVKVWTEVEEEKFKSLPAKIVSKSGSIFKIRYLSITEETSPKNKRVYKYEDEQYDITDDSIIEYLDSELDLGFENIGDDCYVKCDYLSDDEDSDEDYVPSSCCSSSSSYEDDVSEDEDDYEEFEDE